MILVYFQIKSIPCLRGVWLRNPPCGLRQSGFSRLQALRRFRRKYFVEQGEFGSAVDKEGNLYVADGEIYVFDKDGKKKGMIRVPERPSTLQFGGKDGNTLFVTGRSKFFGVRIK